MKIQRTIGFLAVALLLTSTGTAQTTSSGPGIDIEIVNPVDGSNNFCVELGVPFWAEVWVRPGNQTTTCTLGCGTADGGTGNIATAAIEARFDTAKLTFGTSETNPGTAAVDGLFISTNAAVGRVGWSLAGDWIVDGNPSSGLNDPCTMTHLNTPGWTFRVQLTATAAGNSLITLPVQPHFQLSFADHCGAAPFTVAGGDIDELVVGYVTTECTSQTDFIFGDGLETATTGRWSASVD